MLVCIGLQCACRGVRGGAEGCGAGPAGDVRCGGGGRCGRRRGLGRVRRLARCGEGIPPGGEEPAAVERWRRGVCRRDAGGIAGSLRRGVSLQIAPGITVASKGVSGARSKSRYRRCHGHTFVGGACTHNSPNIMHSCVCCIRIIKNEKSSGCQILTLIVVLNGYNKNVAKFEAKKSKSLCQTQFLDSVNFHHINLHHTSPKHQLLQPSYLQQVALLPYHFLVL